MGRRGSVFPGLTVPAAGNGRRESMLSPGATPSGGGRRGSMLPGLSVSPSNSRRGSKAVNTLGLWGLLLPPANEVCGKVYFYTCLSVILFTGESVWWDLHPGGGLPPGGCLHPGRSALGEGRSPSDTTGYGQQVGDTHPTGMHSCSVFNFSIEIFIIFATAQYLNDLHLSASSEPNLTLPAINGKRSRRGSMMSGEPSKSTPNLRNIARKGIIVILRNGIHKFIDLY